MAKTLTIKLLSIMADLKVQVELETEEIYEMHDICIPNEDMVEYLSELPPYELKNFFCDMLGVGHYTEKGELLKLLSDKI